MRVEFASRIASLYEGTTARSRIEEGQTSSMANEMADQTDEASRPFTYRTWAFYWIGRVSGRYRARMEERLRLKGLDMPRWRVLLTLYQDRRAAVSEIAEHASTKLATMTRIVERMEADGLVCRQSRPDHKRYMDVVLTEAGEIAGREAWESADAIYRQAFEGFAPEEIDQLNILLQRVADNLNESRI